MKYNSLIQIIAPSSGSKVLIYDVHASESGALAILNDLYNQILAYPDKSIKWIFVVSTPIFKETDNVVVKRFPWVKKGWIFRYYFNKITTRSILREFNPDKVLSLQNEGISFFKKEQFVYLHLPFILTDHIFKLREDGKTLWLYQNVISTMIFNSLRNVDYTIVQTQWMKDALIKKAQIDGEKVIVLQPDISSNSIGKYVDCKDNRKRFFYPATAFTYKNHITLLKAIKYAQDKGMNDYEVLFTIEPDENKYTRNLYSYSHDNELNIIFGGMMSRFDVFKRYTNSILLFPSYVESFGLPLLEAKMSGTYIIASDTPYSREILGDYDKAFFFDERDYQTMGKLILNLQKL